MKNPSTNSVASRFGKLAACLLLGCALLPQSGRSAVSYATATLSNSPAAFWQLDETGFTGTGTLPASDSSGNGLHGTYGSNSYNGGNFVYGPANPPYAGFAVNQGALQCTSNDVLSVVTLPALNLNTNAVTIAMWINPQAPVATFTGLLFNRNSGGGAAGFGFGSDVNGSGMAALGYTWNNNAGNTWGYDSGIFPVPYIWQFAALVIRSNSATFYLYYIDPNTLQTNLFSAANSIAHNAEGFTNGATFLGSDALGAGTPDAGRIFPGQIAGAAVYKSALSQSQILALFAAGVGVDGFAPAIGTQPKSSYALSGTPVRMSGTAGGTEPLAYQWQLNGTNVNLLPNSANFTGATSNVLNILSATTADAGTYQLIVTNLIGTAVSSNATLTIHSPTLVGKWFTNSSLSDVSGFAPAGIHDGFPVGGSASTLSYAFSSDVPFGKSGMSLWLTNTDTAIAISNSSTLDLSYTDTFDERINNAMSVALWAKGWPSGWSPFASKYGEAGLGWQLRQNGQNNQNPCWTVRGAGGTVALGTAVYGNSEDLAATGLTLGSDTNNWHYYVGTFNAATGQRDLYVDGQHVGSVTNGGLYNLSPASFLCIGGRDNGGTNYSSYFNGKIYDTRLFNYALTHSEIVAEYGAVPPTIVVQPTPASAFLGGAIQLTAIASGTPPLVYQWKFNGTNVNLLPNSANYTGANSNVLGILSLSSNEVGSYQLTVTNFHGSDISDPAGVSIIQPVLIGRWFSGATNLADVSGHQAPGTHDGYGVGAATYGFTNDVPPGLSGYAIQFPGTDSGIAISNSSTADGVTYTNTFDTASLSVAFWAKDRGPFGGNWHAWVAKGGYNNNGEYNGLGWSIGIEAWSQFLYFAMEGLTSGPGGIGYTLGEGLWGDGILRCEQNNLPGENTAWHHYAVTYSPGARVRRTYFDGAMVAEQTNILGYNLASSKHLTIGAQEQTVNGMVGFNRTTIYDVRMYNYALASNEVVAMIPDPVITVQPPSSLNAFVGGTAKIIATPRTLATPVTNQWQLNGTNLVDGPFAGGIISGAKSSVLTIGNVTTSAAGVYRLVVSNPNGTVISSNATLNILTTVPAPGGNLVGAWLTGAASLADTSGFMPAGTHDGYGVTGAGAPASNYVFTNDLPPQATGQSLALLGGTTIAITNSSGLDAGYTNTFDDVINSNLTVTVWAKGWPGGWNPWVAKYGENGVGWQLRRFGNNNTTVFTVRGTGTTDDPEGSITSNDGQWHHYAGTYDVVTGIRRLYVDGAVASQTTGNGVYTLSTNSHLTIGGRDNGGNSFGNDFTGLIYDARIYNVALSEAQINSFMPTNQTVYVPAFSGPPVLSGGNFVLTWPYGSLQQATNVTGPWVSTGATSPYTNNVTTSPRMFFRLTYP